MLHGERVVLTPRELARRAGGRVRTLPERSQWARRAEHEMVAGHLGVVRARREPIEPDGDHHRRHLRDVVDQVGRRVDHALLARVGVHALVGGQVRPADRGIRLGDGRLQIGIVDHHPSVALAVAAHRRVAGDVDALQQQLPWHRPGEVEALPHLLGGGEEVVSGSEIDVGHGLSLPEMTRGPRPRRSTLHRTAAARVTGAHARGLVVRRISAAAGDDGHPRRPRPSPGGGRAHRARRSNAASRGGPLHRPHHARGGRPIVVHRSRFEVDLNRPRHSCVYEDADAAWGLEVWREPLTEEEVERSRRLTTRSTRMLDGFLDELARRGPFVVLDIHSYNHRRDGRRPSAGARRGEPRGQRRDRLARPRPVGPRRRPLHGRPRAAAGRPAIALDVRENVRFRGGHLSQLGARALRRSAAARWPSSSRRCSWTSGPASPTTTTSTS